MSEDFEADKGARRSTRGGGSDTSEQPQQSSDAKQGADTSSGSRLSEGVRNDSNHRGGAGRSDDAGKQTSGGSGGGENGASAGGRSTRSTRGGEGSDGASGSAGSAGGASGGSPDDGGKNADGIDATGDNVRASDAAGDNVSSGGGADGDKSSESGSDAGGDSGGGGGDKGSSGPVQMPNKGGIKNIGADATDVDYSDKGMKDRLEHQAADLAMDATPGLNKFNSARKALKKANKSKRDQGIGSKGADGDIMDKTEEGADKLVDGGIKATKNTLGAAAGSGGTIMAGMGMLLMKAMMALKGAIMALASKLLGFFAGIFQAVSGFVGAALGVATAAANVITTGLMTIFMVGAVIVVPAGAGFLMPDDDAGLAGCVPEHTSVASGSQDYLADGAGEASAAREENAEKLWSVYSEIGGTKAQTAAVLGNLHYESGGLDPTAMETIGDEPFIIGPRKQAAIAADYLISAVDSNYANRFPSITHMGIGLAQWTNDRNRLLVDFADDMDAPWHAFDTQVMFMLDGDDSMRQQQLQDFLSGGTGNISQETEAFMNGWIGLSSPNSSLSARQSAATDYMFTLERATVDTDYADSILSGVNVDRASGNDAASAYHEDDGCGDAIKTHYANQAVDGTGEVPADLSLVPWTRETLPDSLKEFAKNPEDAGLAWGNSSGWANGVWANQCVALSASYMQQLYPAWDKDGRSTSRPRGDGHTTADGWAAHFGESVTYSPSAGAVFSSNVFPPYGHTGIVQHVFANGDILINEQNVTGASGEMVGLSYSWNWRVIKSDTYQDENWKFFKPSGMEPQWGGLEN